MMGAPFAGPWEEAAGAALYSGAGSGELLWYIIAAAICALALVIGAIQEGASFRRLE